MGAAGGTQATSGKTLHDGKEYDFVFTVDIEDGKPPLKLPYNRDQDPWYAAQDFIHKNNLPQAYLEQVANFIVQNSGGNHATAPTNNDYVDPFTGASRYTPGTNNGRSAPSGVNLDPFTGGSSYSTLNSQPRQAQVFTAAPDPFTGSQAYTTSTQSISTDSQTSSFFPQLHYLKFTQGNTQVILEKMREFNKQTGDRNCGIEESLLMGVVKLADESGNDELYIDVLIQLLDWPSGITFSSLLLPHLTHPITCLWTTHFLLHIFILNVLYSLSLPHHLPHNLSSSDFQYLISFFSFPHRYLDITFIFSFFSHL